MELGELGLQQLFKEHNLKLRKTTVDKLLYAAIESISKSILELSRELFS